MDTIVAEVREPSPTLTLTLKFTCIAKDKKAVEEKHNARIFSHGSQFRKTSTDPVVDYSIKKPEVVKNNGTFSPLEDSKRLYERYMMDTAAAKYEDVRQIQQAEHRESKVNAMVAHHAIKRLDREEAEARDTNPRTVEYMMKNNVNSTYLSNPMSHKAYSRNAETVRGPLDIAFPKSDNRTKLRNTILSLGAFGDERSNKAVYPYQGVYGPHLGRANAKDNHNKKLFDMGSYGFL